MNEDKRSQEASSLRIFFDEQIEYLQELLENLSNYLFDEQPSKEEQKIVEDFVDASNKKIRAVQDYANKLRGYVQALYRHVLQIADQVPPPINFDRDAFINDPLVNTLFVLSNDIDKLFDTDPDINAYLRSHDKLQIPIIYALLTAKKSEKQMLGVGMLGDMVVHDVRQEAVNFSSHKLHYPCAGDTELNSALKTYLFSRVVTLIKQEMTSRLASQLADTSDVSYESRVNSLANPDVYLDTLVKHIEIPSSLLSIDKSHFKLSKLGIKLDNDDKQSANEFDIHEIVWSDQSRNVILKITRPR